MESQRSGGTAGVRSFTKRGGEWLTTLTETGSTSHLSEVQIAGKVLALSRCAYAEQIAIADSTWICSTWDGAQ